MNKPVLGVDADDVIWDLCGQYVEHHNRRHGTNFTYEDVYTFDMIKMYGLPREVILENIDRLLYEEHHKLVPFAGAVAAFTKLATVYDLQIITSRGISTRDITIKALEGHAPGLFSDFHFTNGFSGDSHPKLTKRAVCQQIGAVALIEDAPVNIIEVANAGIPVYMHKRSWNTLVHHPELDHDLVIPFTYHHELSKLLGIEWDSFEATQHCVAFFFTHCKTCTPLPLSG